MPTIINDPHSGNIFGRLGKGIGQGFSQQLPKELERNRQANAIESLSKHENLGNPLQQMSSLIRSGFTPESAKEYLPYLQNQYARQQYTGNNAVTGTSSGGGATPTAGIQNKSTSLGNVNPKTGFVSKADITEHKSKLLQKPGYQDIKNLAVEKYAPLYPTASPSQLEEFAEKELLQNLQQQQTGISKLRKDISDSMSLNLQGAGLGDYKDVFGEIQKDLLDQAEHMYVQQGLSPEEAAEKISDVITDLGKANNNLKESGHRSIFQSKEKIEDAKRQRQQYAELGFGELFDDMASRNLGISRLETAHELDPIENERINEILKEFPGKNGSMTTKGGKPKKFTEADMDRLIRSIQPKDNLFAIEYELRERGIQITDFKRRARILESEKEIHKFSDQQDHQLKAPVNNSFLGDILFRVFK